MQPIDLRLDGARDPMYEEEDNCCYSKESNDRCFVISVSFLIGFCFFSYWYIIVIPWRWIYEPSLVGIINLVGLHVCFSLLCISYYKTMTTCPGYVEKGWIPPGVASEELQIIKDETDQNVKKTNFLELSHFYQPRWCKFCKNWKPPRSHHCKDINECVLKMDHYCPWVYNAVGFRNHKYFILFLYYASLCLSYFLVCCVIRVIQELNANQEKGLLIFGVLEGIIFMMQIVLTLPVTIGIVSLFIYQAWCLTSNFTSVESFSYEQYKRVARKAGEDFKWFYDFGFLHNIKQVLGPTIQEWFLPIIPEHIKYGDGTTWKTRQLQLKSVFDDTENSINPSHLHKRQTKSTTEENTTLLVNS